MTQFTELQFPLANGEAVLFLPPCMKGIDFDVLAEYLKATQTALKEQNMKKDQRSAIARKAARARWNKPQIAN